MTDKPDEMPDEPTQMDENQLALFGKILHTHMPHWKEWIEKLITQAQGASKLREALIAVDVTLRDYEAQDGGHEAYCARQIIAQALKGNE